MDTNDRQVQPNGEIAENPPQEEADPRIPGGFWLRFLAYLLDAAIVLCVISPFLLFLRSQGIDIDILGEKDISVAPEASVKLGLLSFLFPIAFAFAAIGFVKLFYFPIFESSALKATPGKLAFGLYVVSYEGWPCSFLRAFARNLLKIVSALPFCLGYFMAGVSLRKQALHDLLSNTLVVRKPEFGWLQIAPSLVFTLSLNILALFLVKGGEEPKPAGKIPDLPVRPAAVEPAEPAIIPAADGLGYAEAGSNRVLFKDVAAVLQRPMKEPETFQFSNPPIPTMLEFALFPEPLSGDERTELQAAPSMLQARERIGKEPGLVLQLILPSDAAACEEGGAITGRVHIRRSALLPHAAGARRYVPLAFSPPVLSEQGALTLLCEQLAPGGKAFLSFQWRAQDKQEKQEYISNLRFETKLLAFKTPKSIVYNDYSYALAVWHQRQSLLTIGFYRSPLEKADLMKIRHSGHLDAGDQRPAVIASLPLQARLRNIRRDDVIKGYSLDFRPDSGQSAHQIELPEGTMPETLIAELKEGKRAFGRFEGKRLVASAGGDTEISWSLSFNAAVIVVP